MKKKLLLFTVFAVAAMSLTACGKDGGAADVEPELIQPDAGVGNPIEEVKFSQIAEVTGCNIALRNMEDPTFLLINNDMGEVRYKTENGTIDITLRIQKADKFNDISGLYYEWTDCTDQMVIGLETAQYSYSGDDGNMQLILWYDEYAGVMYSLAAQGKNVENYDIYSAAVNTALTDEPMEDFPSNEFEERVGKTSFESYDEIIGLLEGEEAYALVKILGYDGEVLLVASGTFDNGDGNVAAIDSTLYTMKSSGMVTADSVCSSQGTAYPVAIDAEGLIYFCTHTSVDVYAYADNGTDDKGLFVINYISSIEVDDNGEPTKVSGFHRETSNLSVIDNDGIEYAEDDVAALNKAYEDYAAAKAVNFTKK